MGYLLGGRLQTTGDVQDLTVAVGDIANNTLTGAKLTANARRDVVHYQIEDLGAGADIAGRVIWRTPGFIISIQRIRLIFEQATAGVGVGAELTVAVTGPGGALMTTGALAGDQAAGTISEPALGNNANIAANSDITLDVTQVGAGTNAGRMSLIIEWDHQL